MVERKKRYLLTSDAIVLPWILVSGAILAVIYYRSELANSQAETQNALNLVPSLNL